MPAQPGLQVTAIAGGCEMTPGNEPLLCSCGDHSAVYVPPKKKQSARWMVMAAKVAGNKPRPVTNLPDKEKALKRIRALCAGTDVPRSTQSAAVGAMTPAPPGLRERRVSVSYDDTVRNASCPAGPGRGHKRQVPADEGALKTAQNVLKKPKPTNEELRAALNKLTEQHKLLQHWYGKAVSERNQAFALLREDYSSTSILNKDKTIEENEEERTAQRRAMVTELMGEGYDLSGSQRTFHRHKALVMAQIKHLAGRDNTVGQQQLAEAILCHYKGDREANVVPGSDEYGAHVAVIDGLVDTLETLRKRNNGRFRTKDRITQEVILTAAMSKAKGQVLQSISRLLRQSRDSLRKAAARVEAVAGNHDRDFFTMDEKSCNTYPAEYSEFVGYCWDDLTRPSECAKDEAKDPVADSSGAQAK